MITNRSVFIPIKLMPVGALNEIRVLLCVGAWSFYSSFVKKEGKIEKKSD